MIRLFVIRSRLAIWHEIPTTGISVRAVEPLLLSKLLVAAAMNGKNQVVETAARISPVEHARENEQWSSLGFDIAYRYRTPVAGIPTSIVGGVKPEFAAPKLQVDVRPRGKPAPSGVAGARPAMRQKASVDGRTEPPPTEDLRAYFLFTGIQHGRYKSQ
jgi:hypothetical protein